VGQVELIKETRKVLKKKIRKVVDQYGPKLFDNFDKMREVMFDPTISQRSRAKKREMKKSSSATRLSRETDLKFNRK
jgi:hemoglobin-like flavoprotein